jgi:hypothetical protein
MDREPFRPAWDEVEADGMASEDQRTEDAICRRLVADLRLKGGKLPPWLSRRIREEPYLRDACDDPSCYRPLLERTRFLLLDRRVKRAGQAKLGPPRDEQASPVLEPEEVRRSEVLSKELARLSLHVGGHWDAKGNRIIPPIVLHYREEYLGGNPITEDQAGAFIDSPAIQNMGLSHFRKSGIPLVGHTARISKRDELAEREAVWHKAPGAKRATKRSRITHVWRKVDIEVEWPGGSASTWVQYELGLKFQAVRVPRRYWPRGEKLAGPYSALADLQKIGARLAEHYLWNEGEANWFVLTGIPPSSPCFRVEFEGGIRNDHVQHRLTMSIQPWVSAKTVMRAYRQLQKDILRRENRQPRLDRLELMDFVSERRHADMPWRDVMNEWNRTHRRWSYGKDGVRNFQRDFEDIYFLVVAERGKPRQAKQKKA